MMDRLVWEWSEIFVKNALIVSWFGNVFKWTKNDTYLTEGERGIKILWIIKNMFLHLSPITKSYTVKRVTDPFCFFFFWHVKKLKRKKHLSNPLLRSNRFWLLICGCSRRKTSKPSNSHELHPQDQYPPRDKPTKHMNHPNRCVNLRA